MRSRALDENEKSRRLEAFQSTGPENGSVEPKVEAAGSTEAKICSTEKRLPEGRRVLTIVFKKPALSLFERAEVSTDTIDENHLTFDLGDPGSISASFLVKDPGAELDLTDARMDFRYDGGDGLLEAHERLIYDALIGDKTLLTRADGIERLWEVVQPVLDEPPPSIPYEPGTWGPAEANELIAPRGWHLPADH